LLKRSLDSFQKINESCCYGDIGLETKGFIMLRVIFGRGEILLAI
jgi:hypothetical protein